MKRNKALELEDIEIKDNNPNSNQDENFKHHKVSNPQNQRDNRINNNIENNDIEHDGTNDINSIPEIEIERKPFKVPAALFTTFIVTTILAGLGLVLFILGFIERVAYYDPGKGITFWVLGLVVMIPGGYYSYQFWLARRCEDEDKRNQILDQIPELHFR